MRVGKCWLIVYLEMCREDRRPHPCTTLESIMFHLTRLNKLEQSKSECVHGMGIAKKEHHNTVSL